jgi:Flp pilus assembly protein TadG
MFGFRIFFRDDRAAVAVMFALSLLAMIGLVGLGIDVSRTLAFKFTWDAAADAAALAAVTQAEATIQQGGTTAQAQSSGQKAGNQLLFTDVISTVWSLWTRSTINVTVAPPSGSTLTADVTYSTYVPTVFG